MKKIERYNRAMLLLKNINKYEKELGINSFNNTLAVTDKLIDLLSRNGVAGDDRNAYLNKFIIYYNVEEDRFDRYLFLDEAITEFKTYNESDSEKLVNRLNEEIENEMLDVNVINDIECLHNYSIALLREED